MAGPFGEIAVHWFDASTAILYLLIIWQSHQQGFVESLLNVLISLTALILAIGFLPIMSQWLFNWWEMDLEWLRFVGFCLLFASSYLLLQVVVDLLAGSVVDHWLADFDQAMSLFFSSLHSLVMVFALFCWLQLTPLTETTLPQQSVAWQVFTPLYTLLVKRLPQVLL